MLMTASSAISSSERIVRPVDFRNGTEANGTLVGDEIARRGVRYVAELPRSVVSVPSVTISKLQELFLDRSIDAIFIPATAKVIDAIASIKDLELNGKIEMGKEPLTFAGRIRYLRSFKRSFPSISPPPADFIDTIIREDLINVGAFLRGVRQLMRADSEECCSMLLNRPGVGAKFHIHRDRIFAVRAYKGLGTEFLLSANGDVFQLNTGDLMIFKGNNFYHRQPPPTKDVLADEQLKGFNQRILHSMSVYIG